MPRNDSLETPLAREEEVAREWQWLHDALNEIARVRAERGDAAAFRLMQQQAIVVGHRAPHAGGRARGAAASM